MESKSNFKVLGLMSGTSLDGLDLAFCKFTKKASGWTYSIEQAEVKRYPAAWKQKLSQAQLLPSQELLALDVEYGRFPRSGMSRLCKQAQRKATLYRLARTHYFSPACPWFYLSAG